MTKTSLLAEALFLVFAEPLLAGKTKTAEKPYPFGAAHIYIAHIREYTPGPCSPYRGVPCSAQSLKSCIEVEAVLNTNISLTPSRHFSISMTETHWAKLVQTCSY